jgi:hypothetical protein
MYNVLVDYISLKMKNTNLSILPWRLQDSAFPYGRHIGVVNTPVDSKRLPH